MKLFVLAVLFTVQFCASSARIVPHGDRNLFDGRKSDVNKDLDDIIALIPRSQIEEIVKNWVSKDQEVNKDWMFATSDVAKNRVKKLENSNEFRAVQAQLEGANINVQHFANIIHEIIGLGPMPASSNRQKRQNAGLRGCLDEVRPTVPMTKIILTVVKKLALSSQFRDFANLLKNQDFKNNLRTLFDSEVSTGFINDAENSGVDMQAIYDFIGSLSPIYTALMKD